MGRAEIIVFTDAETKTGIIAAVKMASGDL